MEHRELGWLCLVALFLASLLIVLGWLLQYSLTFLRLRRARATAGQVGGDPPQGAHASRQSVSKAALGFLLKFWKGRRGAPAHEAGVKGLLTSMFSFKSVREHWQRTWVNALNEQACRQGSSIQITFDNSLQFAAASRIDAVTCVDQSAHRTVLHCTCWVDAVTFPVTVTQQSPAAVSMDTYQVTAAPAVTKVVVRLEEVEDEGLLVSWSLCRQPPLSLTVSPCKLHRKGAEGVADLDVIRGLVEDTVFSTQPAMVLSLRPSACSPVAPMDHLSVGSKSVPPSVLVRRLQLRQLRVTLSKGQWVRSAELCCVLSLDQPSTEKSTRFLPLSSSSSTVEWSEEISLELRPETKELTVRLLERDGKREQFLPGHASITLEPRCKVPTGRHVVSISPGHGLAPNATFTAELALLESQEPPSAHNALLLRSSLTPTKKVDVDRTIMPDGTIVTTVTTVQSRLKVERSPGESPLRSPSKVEVNEKKAVVLSEVRGSPDSGKSSRLSNGLDPVAETAIRQLTESASKVARKTPTKRSTLIISGVSKVPLSEDDCALSSGYAAAMDAAMHSNHYGGGGRIQDPEETTPSDVSERPSVEDVESDTGSTGALETRSLKDHRVGFLQSGSKLLFRRRRREKEACLSQSHEDISNMGNSFAAASAGSRKTSGSFSRRLIKHFSFRSSGKSKAKATATNGGSSPLGN